MSDLTPAQSAWLTKLLDEAKKRPPMTPAEIREQRISFAYGQLMDCAPTVTKEQVRRICDEGDGVMSDHMPKPDVMLPPLVGFVSRSEYAAAIARAEKAEAEVARLRTARGAADAGQIWAEVRSALTLFRERFTEAFAAEIYEMQSAKLDGLAREVTERIERRLRALAGPDGRE